MPLQASVIGLKMNHESNANLPNAVAGSILKKRWEELFQSTNIALAAHKALWLFAAMNRVKSDPEQDPAVKSST